MNLHFASPEGHGTFEVAGPQNAPSQGLEFALFRSMGAEQLQDRHDERETILVLLSGTCTVEVVGRAIWHGLGSRDSVFSGRATAVYVPPGQEYRVAADGLVEVGICRAPSQVGPDAYLIRPDDIRVRSAGHDSFRREIHDIVDVSRPASRLIVGETFNEPGSWSSYPPHKHDEHDPPNEVQLQEIYHYRLDPPEGFGLQRIYSPERAFDAAYVVQDSDTILIPFGYHPVVGAGGYRLYYLWMLAGQERALRPRLDSRLTVSSSP